MTLLAEANADLGGVQPLLFYTIALLVCLSAWAIVLSQNIVRMAVYLLLTLSGAAAFYLMLEAEFLGAIQLIVYAGGTQILIIFGVMLTSKNPFMQLRVQLWERIIAVTLAAVIAGLIGFAAASKPIGGRELATTGSYDQVQAIGQALLSTHLVPFEIAGVLLLVVMIGAAYMARRRTRE